ncbi:phospholipid-transporting ATPase ABCA3-like [Bacillus rossius redtenbacheri]|uniref:phospholipid-transporting ATPase ABCA3-like n=1 Tax=Bacillus rossius redtenbacheri TaxID=93214 RepID=UPI002FDD52EB
MSYIKYIIPAWKKFRLLMWKNWMLRWRHPFQTTTEVLIPVFYCIVLIFIRSRVAPKLFTEPTIYEPFSPANYSGTIIDYMEKVSSQGVVVAYSPASPVLDRIMTKAVQRFRKKGTAVPFSSEAALHTQLTELGAMYIIIAGVVFDDSLAGTTELPQHIQYRIRFPGESRSARFSSSSSMYNWKTDRLLPMYQEGIQRIRKDTNHGNIPDYHAEGFLTLQHFVSASIIEQVSGNALVPLVLLRMFPWPPYLNDPLFEVMKKYVSIMVLFSFMYSCTFIVNAITSEKEMQLKEFMKIMGLPSWLHWTAWFVNCFLVLLTAYSRKLAVWTCSSFHSASATQSPSSPHPNLAVLMAALGWFLLYAPYIFLEPNYGLLGLATKLAFLLCCNTAMALGFLFVLMFEGSGRGLQWDSLWQPATQGDSVVFGHVLIFLVVDAILYLLIALYVEAVYPGVYGVPKPWNFFLKKSFWFGGEAATVEPTGDNLWISSSSDFVETEPALPIGIQTKELRKVFGKKVVVDGLSLNMYEGHITVLLGHNGAGKTTTIAMLTGMLPPSGGTATVGGRDVRTQMDGVRASLGVCPQHNVLFNDLTVAEHLYFFGKLKGMETREIQAETQRYLSVLELLPKQNAQARSLSGGMKRKLCAAIALCGRSKVVVIDEPTSGMDPAARRKLWDLLRQERHGRTILLTTHFMDEADFLGDRIAIMASGRLKCCGSPFFLKKKYGVGYKLVMVKRPECRVEEVTRLLRGHISSLEVSQDVGAELSYQLEEGSSALFEPMLRELEDARDRLGIDSFGMALTSMEEVFIRVGRDEELSLRKRPSESVGLPAEQNFLRGDNNGTSSYRDSTLAIDDVRVGAYLTGRRLVLNQIHAMSVKHVLHTVRSWVMYVAHLLMPVLFLMTGFLLSSEISSTSELPALVLSLGSYSTPITPVEVASGEDSAKRLYEQFKALRPPGLVDLGSHSESTMSTYVLEQAVNDITSYTQNFIVGATFSTDSASSAPEATGWFSNQPFHAAPVALNLIHNSILRSTPAGSGRSISVVNHPVPYSAVTEVRMQMSGNMLGFQVAYNLVLGMASVSAFFVLFYVKERVSRAKLLQFVSGVDVLTFWGTAFLWDLLKFFVIALAIVVTLACFQKDGFSEVDQLGRILLMLMLFCCAMLPTVYLMSFLFSVPATGYTWISMFYWITGMTGLLLVTAFPNLGLDWVFVVLFPLYSLGSSVNHMHNNAMLLETCAPFRPFCSEQHPNSCCIDPRFCPNRTCIKMTENYFEWETPGVGRNVVFFIMSAIVFSTILLLIELNIVGSVWYSLRERTSNKPKVMVQDYEPDSDVVVENFNVRSANPYELKNTFDVVLIDLTKFYGSLRAVNELCMRVRKGECFGLLGVNGAGKTSTFKMMTGDERISSGEAYIGGFSLKNQLKQVHRRIGYCPQSNALMESLTGRETLWLFCMLRGVPGRDVPAVVDRLAGRLLLREHLDKKVKEYSGGNKRKLSTAVALLGDPPVLILDEPTTGMDVVAKRHFWDVICRARDSGKCVVLTSHSMEECEALCTRIAIMVNGQFRCIGPTQHLKNKFAEGYTLTVKTSDSGLDTRPVKEFVASSFEGASLREEQGNLLTFYIPPNSGLKWSRMFGVMERAKASLHISGYSLGQTSLEQVFLIFSKQQGSPMQERPQTTVIPPSQITSTDPVPPSPIQIPDTPISPLETPISPPETPISPPETPISPPETPISPPETPISPPETPISPPETQTPSPISRYHHRYYH